MPIYEYQCQKCEKTFEIYQRISETNKDIKCPVCRAEKPVRKISAFNSGGLGGYNSAHSSCSSGGHSGFG